MGLVEVLKDEYAVGPFKIVEDNFYTTVNSIFIHGVGVQIVKHGHSATFLVKLLQFFSLKPKENNIYLFRQSRKVLKCDELLLLYLSDSF